MTKLLFLGSGSAFTIGTDNFQSNMLLVSETGKKLLIDCGSDIRHSLYHAGFSYRDISDIYVSHNHSDHIGGLEYIGFSTKFDPRCNKPKLYLGKELTENLWFHSLSGGMEHLEGEVANLETYFELGKIDDDNKFIWEKIIFQLIKVVHVDSGNHIIPSYGLFFEINGIKIFFTTDSQLCLDVLEIFYNKADIIFQDCETCEFPTHVHAHYQELLTLPSTIKKKMWLYHYHPELLPDARKDGFCGFVQIGQIFDFSSHYRLECSNYS